MFAANSARRRLLSVLFLLVISLSQSEAYSPVPRLDLKGRSYQLDLRVAVKTAKETTIYEIAEFHSARQRRSRLQYTISEPKQQSAQLNILYASEQEHILTHGRRSACASLERNQLDKYFCDNVLAGFDSDHLVGAARLLLYIERNFDKFLIKPNEDDRPGNLLAYSAKFVNRNQSDHRFELQLFYHVEAIQNLAYGIPHHIKIITPTRRIDYMIKRLKDLWDDRLQVDSSDASASTLSQGSIGASVDMIAFDFFAVERAIGCSQFYKDESKRFQEELQVTGKYRFSFNARPPIERGLGQLDISVAYEPSVGVLRIDHRHETRTMTTMTDYLHSRKFHIVRKASPTSTQVDPVLDKILGADSDSSDMSCVVTRSRAKGNPFNSMTNPFTLGQMLLGTERLFYLGLAYVRGIEARVFEWDGCQWPVWLQQPAVYHTRDPSKEPSVVPAIFRDEAQCIKERGFSLTSVLYFSNDAEDFKLANSKLLLVEVFTRIQRTGAVMNRKLYPIYDFTWTLPSSSPSGERYEDLFSLSDECLAELDENNEYGAISMSLETKVSAAEDQRLNWLLERTKRNIAILNMAQLELFLMSTMIFDVESHLLVGTAAAGQSPGSSDQNEKQMIPYRVDATMRVAQRTKALAELIFVGRGFLTRSNLEIYSEFSFEMCHMMAAHRKVDTAFAYEAPESYCYLLEPGLKGDLDAHLSDVFKLSNQGIAEIYKIRHVKKAALTSEDYINRVKASKTRIKRVMSVRMFDPTPAKTPTTESFEFTAFYFDAMNDELDFDLNDLHWNGDSKFLGFGLDPTSSQNKQVEPKWTTDPDTKSYHPQTMSFEHCQTACLADLECNSYSLCTRNGKISCVLSRISFDSPSMAIQLIKAAGKRLEIGKTFKVELDSSEQSDMSEIGPSKEVIEVIRHPACELHNKIYRDFFKKTPQTTSIHVTSISEPVPHLEECAKLCYRVTLTSLREQANRRTKAAVSEKTGEPGEICGHFHYIDHENLVAKDSEVAATISKHFSEGESTIGGYCFIAGLRGPSNGGPDTNELFRKAWLMMEHYEFNVMSLYAKHDGVYLAQSQMTLDEKLAMAQVGVKEGLTHPLVIREHENFGSIQSRGDPQDCAKICFDEKTRVAFPLCRSFDFIEFLSPPTGRFCSFNSMTLKSTLEAQRFDLINYGNEPQTHDNSLPRGPVKVTHYEPREGLVARSLEEHYRVDLAREKQEINKITTISAGSKHIHLAGFGLFCLVMFTLVSGLVMGVVVGSKLLASLVVDSESGESLVEERGDEPEAPRIRFSNLVNSEGQIADQTQAPDIESELTF